MISEVGRIRDKLTLLVTATCSFMAYDNPAITSGGEHTLLNPNGGAVALFSTVRSVFSSSNEKLTREAFKNLFKPVSGQRPAVGEIMRIAKNANFNTNTRINSRKFTVFGDPSMPLAIPLYDAVTTSINGQAVGSAQDTFSALDRVVIEGEIRNSLGEFTPDYNGVLSVTIFDKKIEISTLVNDSGSRSKDFETRKNVVFKGNASIENGQFAINFVVPRDINLSFGEGKISYYAQGEGQMDAKGHYEDVVIGGSSEDPVIDDVGPVVKLYLEDRSFVNGDETSANPLLIVDLEDDYGINVVGNSIGHDLTGILDEEQASQFVMNEFYVSELDNSRKGTAEYPLKDLSPGKHTIQVKAWDVANNSTVESVDFIVSDNFELDLNLFSVFPNPVVDISYFGFEHNLADMQLDYQFFIYDALGREIFSMSDSQFSQDGRVLDIEWQANSVQGMSSGLYTYRFEVEGTPVGSSKKLSAHKYGKFIFLHKN